MKKFDFESVKGRIINNLQSKTSTANILPFGTNARIIDIMSEAISELARFDTYLTRENKWSLAQNRSSLVLQSDILNYKPKRKITASGSVRLTLNEELINLALYRTWSFDRFVSEGTRVAYDGRIYEALNDVSYYTSPIANAGKNPKDTTEDWVRITFGGDENVQIPAFSVFEGGDFSFTNLLDAILVASDDYIELDVVQGIPKIENLSASGDSYEEFFIDDTNFSENYYWVTVNDVEYTEIDDLRLASSNDFVFETKNDPNGLGVYFIFGNGVFGRKLQFGDAVDIRYIRTEGSQGNVISANVVDEVVSDLTFDTLGSAEMFITNEFSIVGGTEEESIEDIRTNAPRLFQTGGRATSARDYVVILETQFDFIGKAMVWGAFEQNIDNNTHPTTFIPVNENRVWISAFNTQGERLTEQQEEQILVEINELKAPTDLITFQNVEVVGIIFEVDAVVIDKSYPLKQVENLIDSSLRDEYSIFNMDFAQDIFYSDFIAFIDNLEGVSYHNSDIAFTETRALTSAYATPTFFLAQDDIEIGSVKIYVKDMEDETADWIYIGKDQALGSSGILVGEGGYSLADSTYEPDVGRVRPVITGGIFGEEPPPIFSNYRVKVEYKTNNINYRLRKRNQIFGVEDVGISIRYRTNFESI